MERRGHPLGGAIAGAVFFFVVGLTLMLFGVVPLGGFWLVALVIGVIVGTLWGLWAPFGRHRPKAVPFIPSIPLGDPNAGARPWTVRQVTGEVPVIAPGERPVPGPVDHGLDLPPIERPVPPPVERPDPPPDER